MDQYLFDHPLYQLHYICSPSFFNIDSIPLSSRQQPLLGLSMIALSSTYELLYLLCLTALSRHLHSSSCYKIMFFIGCIDVVALPFTGILTGWLTMQGAVYCNYPTMLFLAGLVVDSEL